MSDDAQAVTADDNSVEPAQSSNQELRSLPIEPEEEETTLLSNSSPTIGDDAQVKQNDDGSIELEIQTPDRDKDIRLMAPKRGSRDYDYPQKRRRGTISGAIPMLPCVRGMVGRMGVFLRSSTGIPTCMIGPCWPCLSMTYFLIISISLSLFSAILPHVHPILAGLSFGILLFVLGALTFTAFSNPGILPRYSEQVLSPIQ